MFKKKIGIYALTFAMAAMGMTGCSSGSSSSNQTEGTTQSANKASSEPFSVVCTIFPEYDWVKEILGDHADNVELTYLLDNGVDLHSYYKEDFYTYCQLLDADMEVDDSLSWN